MDSQQWSSVLHGLTDVHIDQRAGAEDQCSKSPRPSARTPLVFRASSMASYVTGASINLDGGISGVLSGWRCVLYDQREVKPSMTGNLRGQSKHIPLDRLPFATNYHADGSTT